MERDFLYQGLRDEEASMKPPYNRVFNVVDENSKTVFVRNIAFKDIFSFDVDNDGRFNMPLNDLNQEIRNRFFDLRSQLIGRVLDDKEKIRKILKNIPITSNFMSKFYSIINSLLIEDYISSTNVKERVKGSKNYSKCLELLIDSSFAEYDDDENIKTTNKFKRVLKEESKGNFSEASHMIMAEIIVNHYDYIVHGLGLKQIKSYINIMSCFFYLDNNISLDKAELYKVYDILFGKTKQNEFDDRVNRLITSGVLSGDSSSLILSTA